MSALGLLQPLSDTHTQTPCYPLIMKLQRQSTLSCQILDVELITSLVNAKYESVVYSLSLYFGGIKMI